MTKTKITRKPRTKPKLSINTDGIGKPRRTVVTRKPNGRPIVVVNLPKKPKK